MTPDSVLLGTSFFLRFLNEDDPLFLIADGYYRYFLENEMVMFVSTISIAEYCVGGNIDELPLRNLQILPFNSDHAKQTGKLAKIAFDNKPGLALNQRKIIPNDTKLFGQADIESSIAYYLSSDSESLKIYNLLNHKVRLSFQFVDLNVPHHEVFGLLNL